MWPSGVDDLVVCHCARMARIDITSDERDLLLAALFELRIAHAEYALQAADIEALVVRVGGDPDAVFFGAGSVRVPGRRPTRAERSERSDVSG
jgi:hypothetical protein